MHLEHELHDLTYGQLHDVHLKSSWYSNSEKRAFEHICYMAPSFSGASIILLMQKKSGNFSFLFFFFPVEEQCY